MDNIEKKPKRPRIGENRGLSFNNGAEGTSRYENGNYSSQSFSTADSEYQGERQYSQQRSYNRQGG